MAESPTNRLPIPNTPDHKALYDELKRSPNLIQYLQMVVFENALDLARSDVPDQQTDLSYIKTHCRIKGMITLADEIINIINVGDKEYGPSTTKQQ